MFCFAWLAFPRAAVAGVPGPSRFIPTFLVYYGGGATLHDGDAAALARYDLLDIDRFRYRQIGGNTWAAIKALNPKIEIYLYQMGTETSNYQDGANALSLNNLGRFDQSRGHLMGSLNSHPEFFLTDLWGNRIFSNGYSNTGANRMWYLMDFGSGDYQTYWMLAVQSDILEQPWKADGIFADLCLTFPQAGGYSGLSARYPTNEAWTTAMSRFSAAIAGGLHERGQKLWCNKGDSRSAAGNAAWKALDANIEHPDILLEEGAFAVGWGAQVQFFPEADWKNQIDVLQSIRNSRVGFISHTQLSPWESGTDNYGRPVTFWQTFYYALGSMLVGKSDLNNAYLMFNPGNNMNYNSIVWFDEYDRIDLGQPVGGYAIAPRGAANVYWREYERGYVAVNPTPEDAGPFAFPQPVRPINHDNVLWQAWIAPVEAVWLNAHTAAIVLK